MKTNEDICDQMKVICKQSTYEQKECCERNEGDVIANEMKML
jgi:hypothetical protein